LIPFVPSRAGRFAEAKDNPAFCSEAIRPAIDLRPEELHERHFVRTALERERERTLTLGTVQFQSFRVPSVSIQPGSSCR